MQFLKAISDVLVDRNVALTAEKLAGAVERPSRGFGWRMLPRYKTVNGKRYQLHATRGWKCVGRAS